MCLYDLRQHRVSDHKVHGTLLQRFRYLPHVDGAPFTVVRPPSNIATYCCVLHAIYPSVIAMFPSAVAMSFALHCNAAHHLGVAPFTVVCPTVSTTLDTIYRLLLQCFSSRCSTALEVPHCNTPSSPSAQHPDRLRYVSVIPIVDDAFPLSATLWCFVLEPTR